MSFQRFMFVALTIQGLLWSLVACREMRNPVDSTVTVYIDARPPLGMTTVQWRASVDRALEQWLVPAGCTIEHVGNPDEAEILFRVEQLEQSWGVTWRPTGVRPPYLPHKKGRCYIAISVDCYCSERHDADLHRTLLHEVGHAIGLDHRSESIMTDKWPKPPHLTELDRQSIEELREYVVGFEERVFF